MVRVMVKEGRKKEKFAFSIGSSCPLEAVLKSPVFEGMDITHFEDRVEVRNGNILYIARSI